MFINFKAAGNSFKVPFCVIAGIMLLCLILIIIVLPSDAETGNHFFVFFVLFFVLFSTFYFVNNFYILDKKQTL